MTDGRQRSRVAPAGRDTRGRDACARRSRGAAAALSLVVIVGACGPGAPTEAGSATPAGTSVTSTPTCASNTEHEPGDLTGATPREALDALRADGVVVGLEDEILDAMAAQLDGVPADDDLPITVGAEGSIVVLRPDPTADPDTQWYVAETSTPTPC